MLTNRIIKVAGWTIRIFDNARNSENHNKFLKIGCNIMKNEKTRNCYCETRKNNPNVARSIKDIPEGYCGICDICGEPGHMNAHPHLPTTGSWCDKHWEELIRKPSLHPLQLLVYLIIMIPIPFVIYLVISYF